MAMPSARTRASAGRWAAPRSSSWRWPWWPGPALALWLAVALVVQTCLLQSLLDGLADDTVVFGGLHALDGLLIAASAGVQYVLARRRGQPVNPRPQRSAVPPEPPEPGSLVVGPRHHGRVGRDRAGRDGRRRADRAWAGESPGRLRRRRPAWARAAAAIAYAGLGALIVRRTGNLHRLVHAGRGGGQRRHDGGVGPRDRRPEGPPGRWLPRPWWERWPSPSS